VLGDVGEPDLIRGGGGELVPDPAPLVDHGQQVVVDRSPGLAGLAPTAVVGGEDPRDRAQSPHPVLRGGDAGIGQLVGQEPVAEGGVVLMDLVQDVDRMRVVPVPLGHRVLQPLAVTLGRELQRPARHRDRHPDRALAAAI
jgi:hypothetical protein